MKSCALSNPPPLSRRLSSLLLVVGVALGGALPQLVRAAALVAWDFAGSPRNQVSSSPNIVSGSLQGSALTRGTDLTPAVETDSFSSTGFDNPGTTPAAFTTADTNGDFLSFTLTPNAGLPYSLTSIFPQGSSLSSTVNLVLRTSLDGFTTTRSGPFFSLAIFPSSTTFTIDLSGQPSLQNLTVPVTFHIIGTSLSAAGIVALSGPGNDLVVTGIPEPSTWALLAAASAAFLAFRRRTAKRTSSGL